MSKFDRRLFSTMVVFPALAAGCSKALPTAPTPSPTPNQTLNDLFPVHPIWGIRVGDVRFAGISGTLRQVIESARLNNKIDCNGYMYQFEGQMPTKGFTFLIRRGETFYVSIDSITLTQGEPWAVYVYTGPLAFPHKNC
jgi:hypothetical protein